MTRLFALLCLTCALGCGRVTRHVGSYVPELGQEAQAGAGGQAAAPDSNQPPPLNEAWKSSGCGLPLPARQVATVPGERTGFTSWQVDQLGTTLTGTNPAVANTRQFLVRVPADYDPNRPYRIVYLAQRGCSLGTSDTTTYPLFDEARGGDEQAVYVDVTVPQLDMNPHCYDTGSGPESLEYETFALIHDFVESRYCVDNNRVFVAGYGQGGALSNMWGCYFGGIPDPPRKLAPKWAIRGHAVLAGWREVNQPLPCGGPGAGLWIQEKGDLESGMYGGSNPSSLQLGLNTNGCTGNFDDGPRKPWAPAAALPGLADGICEIYTGCSAQSQTDYPLVFCDADGNGGTDRADLAIPAFTAFFNTMNATR